MITDWPGIWPEIGSTVASMLSDPTSSSSSDEGLANW